MKCMPVNSQSNTIPQDAGPLLLGGRTIRGTASLEGARIRKKKIITSLTVILLRSCLVCRLLIVGSFADDLPAIRENLRKGFLETQSKVNSWVTNLKKRIDGDDLEEEPQQNYEQPSPYGRPRRSGDRERYDADPQVLGDDFSALELRDSEG